MPNYDYSSDNYDNYDDDNLVNEEQETEINYDIKFKSMGTTHVVDKGTTIKLPCNVDKYPGKPPWILTLNSSLVPVDFRLILDEIGAMFIQKKYTVIGKKVVKCTLFVIWIYFYVTF